MTQHSNDSDGDIEEQARRWLVRLRSGRASEADAQAFARWRAQSPGHARAARELGQLWRGLRMAAPAVAREQAMRAPSRGRRAFLGGALATGVALLALRPPLALWPSVGELAADYRTGTGEQRQLALAGGAQVRMNTQTRLNLRGADDAAFIELLAGEAQIVTGGRDACTVLAGGARLQARAASFNVRCLPDGDVELSCLEGRVEVDHPQRRIILSASQQLRYGPAALRLAAPADSNAVLAWRRGLLLFNDTPLEQVVEEFNRYRPGRIFLQSEELGMRRVQAQFSIDKLDVALALIRDLYGARLTYLPGNLVLLS
ncbi:FecR domain-containing protein [Janthinobacterium sp. UMAB-60]|uniref:FecR family protein n=1 Tax=Janthinobacterium sp. UMAB-60 TaxID=1365365 RepID=UPI001C59EF6A|nr:FecR domain-containing protein [Janthinobacterium sp. UMAB-60]